MWPSKYNPEKTGRPLFKSLCPPVEHAPVILPVATFLSLFRGQLLEAQVSQAFRDGNVDLEWHIGSVMIAKAGGL